VLCDVGTALASALSLHFARFVCLVALFLWRTLSLPELPEPVPKTHPHGPLGCAWRGAHGFQVFHDPSRYSARFMSEEASPAA
jgi:hypothetical protein